MSKEATGRRYVDYVVLRVQGLKAAAAAGDAGFLLAASGLADTRAGRRWIKNEGEDGATYQVAALTTRPMTVHVEQVEKRRVEGQE